MAYEARAREEFEILRKFSSQPEYEKAVSNLLDKETAARGCTALIVPECLVIPKPTRPWTGKYLTLVRAYALGSPTLNPTLRYVSVGTRGKYKQAVGQVSVNGWQNNYSDSEKTDLLRST